MKIIYKNNKIKKICENDYFAIKTYGLEMTKKIKLRIKLLTYYSNIDLLIYDGFGRCHKLYGDRRNQYAIDLIHPFRLIFQIIEEEIQIVEILEIADYH